MELRAILMDIVVKIDRNIWIKFVKKNNQGIVGNNLKNQGIGGNN